jgi:hypothetical protein
MTKAKKIETVKDLLNQILVICDKNQDEFLLEVSETVQSLLIQKEVEEDDDYSTSDDFYDSSCV